MLNLQHIDMSIRTADMGPTEAWAHKVAIPISYDVISIIEVIKDFNESIT